MCVEAIQVPPRAEVLRRCPKVLYQHELSYVAKEMIDDRAVPFVALGVHADSVVWGAECEKCVHFEISTAFKNGSRDEPTLRDTH